MTQCKTPALLFQDLGPRRSSPVSTAGKSPPTPAACSFARSSSVSVSSRVSPAASPIIAIPSSSNTPSNNFSSSASSACAWATKTSTTTTNSVTIRCWPSWSARRTPQGTTERPRRDRARPWPAKARSIAWNSLPCGPMPTAATRRSSAHLDAMQKFLVDAFLQPTRRPPERIVLDVDATDNPLHGHQLGRFFHGYYDSIATCRCTFSAATIRLLALLRPANIDATTGLLKHLIRIVTQIRQRWPNVRIVVRGDSGFCREHLMRWCEGNGVDYLFGLAKKHACSASWAKNCRRPRSCSRRPSGQHACSRTSTTARTSPGAARAESWARPSTWPRAPIRVSWSRRCRLRSSLPRRSTSRNIVVAAIWRTASRSSSCSCSPAA